MNIIYILSFLAVALAGSNDILITPELSDKKPTSAFESSSKRRQLGDDVKARVAKLTHNVACVYPTSLNDREIVEALDELEELAHHVDIGELIAERSSYACGSGRKHGSILSFLVRDYLQHNNSDIGVFAYQIIGAALQNNPGAQSHVLVPSFIESNTNLAETLIFCASFADMDGTFPSLLYALNSISDDPVTVSVMFSQWDLERMHKVSSILGMSIDPIDHQFTPFDVITSRFMTNIPLKYNHKLYKIFEKMISSERTKKTHRVIVEQIFASKWWNSFVQQCNVDAENCKHLMLRILQISRENYLSVPESQKIVLLIKNLISLSFADVPRTLCPVVGFDRLHFLHNNCAVDEEHQNDMKIIYNTFSHILL